jgi:hypothetical protein
MLKHRSIIAKDSGLLIMSNEAMCTTAMIFTVELKEVVLVDLLCAFIQAVMDILVHVRFVGKMWTQYWK